MLMSPAITARPMLRWFQAEAEQAIHDYFNSGKTGNPVIALPTGTGKGHLIAGFTKNVLNRWPNQRFIMATHVKELVSQNAEKLLEHWPHAPIGINSAGLKSRDTVQPIIFGGIGSMYKTPQIFGHRDLLIIDEAHLLNPNGGKMYLEFIKGLKEVNPFLKVIGLTATPFRAGMGYITDDGLFTDIIYDMTTRDGFMRLIADGFLAPLVPRPTNTYLDISGVGLSSSGDYNESQLQNAVDKDSITYAALQETLKYGQHYKSWLIFAAGIEHSNHVAEMLNSFGIPAASVHSKSKTRDDDIKAFKAGKLRAIVNNNVLTTGFDHPPVDLIVMLRPTLSVALWVQMLGRGTRPAPGKAHCLVLDFARNTPRLGPINDPLIPRKKGEGPLGEAPVKICEACGNYNHASVRFCEFCGEEFEFRTKIFKEASEAPLIANDMPVTEVFEVDFVHYYRHQSKGKPHPSLKVVYFCKGNIRQFTEFVNLEHGGRAAHFAHEWWKTRINTEPPATINDALLETSKLRVPTRIRVWVNKLPYPQILEAYYD